MSTTKEKKNVEVLVGQHKLNLKTDGDPNRVRRIAEMVNTRLQKIMPFGQPMSQQHLLVLAMNLADELMRNEEDSAKFKAAVKDRSQTLLTKLEKEFPL
jgi:cell division protein ZapA (FtsZ GTPase activity inhibitor)